MPVTLDDIIEMYGEESFLKADGFDSAVIGVDRNSMRLVYSVAKIMNILVIEEKMSVQDAMEHFEYNIEGGYVGERTPIWCYDLEY